MQNFNIFRLLAKYWWLIILITGVVFLAAWGSYKHQAVSSFGSIATTVQVSRSYPNTGQLVLQAETISDAQTMVATTQSWLNDPSTVSDILKAAKVTPADSSLAGLAKVFKIVSTVPNSLTYQVEYTGASADEVSRVFQAMQTVMNQRRDEYNQRQPIGIKVNLTYSDTFVTNQNSSLPLTPIAGLAVGLIFSVIIVAVIDRKRSR
ncbi:hypothetical protein KGQ71_01955 [Patescibacteria group bacterium]|nr:hypothetical protein [Patescibacteria group bacterium]